MWYGKGFGDRCESHEDGGYEHRLIYKRIYVSIFVYIYILIDILFPYLTCALIVVIYHNTHSVCTFNILHGFPEALVRGMRSSFLKDSDYHHLTQCETLDDVRLNMTESDYSECLADSATMTPASLQKSAIQKVSDSEEVRDDSIRSISSLTYLHFIASLVGHGIQVFAYSSRGAIEHLLGFYYVRVHD